MRIEERVFSNIPKNPVWKLPQRNRFIFNVDNGSGWTIGQLKGIVILAKFFAEIRHVGRNYSSI